MRKSILSLFVAFCVMNLFYPLKGKADSVQDENFQVIKYENLYNEYEKDGFTDSELVTLYQSLQELYPHLKELHKQEYLQSLGVAVSNPYIPENTHTGDRFFRALSWYHDTLYGNGDGIFELAELNGVYQKQMAIYWDQLGSEEIPSRRIQTWKMIQKLQLLGIEIYTRDINAETSVNGYTYEPRVMGQVDLSNPWNAQYTVLNQKDFKERVIKASYTKPVLVKFGLTYCIHCLLLENLGSVPAVAKKYSEQIDTYKLWWNPKDSNKKELNNVAMEEGVTSSPYFILYKNGQQIKAGYAFPDENGEGMEEFLEKITP